MSRAGKPYIVTSAAHAERLFARMPATLAAAKGMLASSGSAVAVWVTEAKRGVRYRVDRATNAGDPEIAVPVESARPTETRRDAHGLVSTTLSAVVLQRSCVVPLAYEATWYDYSGHEFAHVTIGWAEARLTDLTGHRAWTVNFADHGNGHRSLTATALEMLP